ncbi:uncharacterized protein PV07_00906 [Cladophialophora immunda]|uniref:Uncharacterized protein n=1 Tax=Cladophialophora immunda TaxID=569365 RepID=A0A0D2CSF4_9EURO|nr:uncharacterized protein PV07_00906 [Cladophialophora immunda]KIW34108.1 hypothetical protein PV07_00906 [Cladophialophora immunda]OQV09768.1 hypothetical protein CLAIMM_13854 [Cladophialophora immunda]
MDHPALWLPVLNSGATSKKSRAESPQSNGCAEQSAKSSKTTCQKLVGVGECRANRMLPFTTLYMSTAVSCQSMAPQNSLTSGFSRWSGGDITITEQEQDPS